MEGARSRALTRGGGRCCSARRGAGALFGMAGYRGMVFTSWTASVFDKMVENVDALNAYAGAADAGTGLRGLTSFELTPRCLHCVPNPSDRARSFTRGGRRETYYKVVRDIRDDPESMHGMDVASLSAFAGLAAAYGARP